MTGVRPGGARTSRCDSLGRVHVSRLTAVVRVEIEAIRSHSQNRRHRRHSVATEAADKSYPSSKRRAGWCFRYDWALFRADRSSLINEHSDKISLVMFDHHFDSIARAVSYNPIEDAVRRMNEMHQDRINSLVRGINQIAIPKYEIAGLVNPALLTNLYATTAIQDAINTLSGVSQLQRAVDSNLQALVSRMDLSAVRENLVSTASVINQITEHQRQLSNQIVNSFREMTDSTRIAFEAIRPQISAYQDWVLTHAATFERFGRFWEEFEANYHITESRAVRVLKKYNWFVSPSLPADFVYEAVRLGRKRGNKLREMNSLFWEYFSENDFENLRTMIESWTGNPLFKGKRIKIIRDCVSTLRQAKRNTNPANVIVPPLIAQIDGVLTKFRKQKGFTKDNCPIHELRVWFEAEATSQDILSEQMLELANYVLFSVLFQTARYGKPLANPFTLSRHKIMHGEYLTYGRRANAIRAFLILDFLAALQ